MKTFCLTLVFVALVLVVNSNAQNSYKIKLDRPAQKGAKYEYVAHYENIDTMSYWQKQSGELFASTISHTTTDIKAAAEVVTLNLKGEASVVRYTIGSFVLVKTQSKDGIQFEPEMTTHDTLVPAGTTLTLTIADGKKTILRNGLQIPDSLCEKWVEFLDNSGTADLDDLADWKKARKVGSEWKIDAKKLSTTFADHSVYMKDVVLDQASLSFDSVFTHNDNPCAAVRLNCSIPLAYSPLPKELLKMLNADSSSITFNSTLFLPVDSSLPEDGFTRVLNFYVHGTLHYKDNTPEIVLLMHSKGTSTINYYR